MDILKCIVSDKLRIIALGGEIETFFKDKKRYHQNSPLPGHLEIPLG